MGGRGGFQTGDCRVGVSMRTGSRGLGMPRRVGDLVGNGRDVVVTRWKVWVGRGRELSSGRV
eukprot:8163549-Pyramimonas_sp.AAC.1